MENLITKLNDTIRDQKIIPPTYSAPFDDTVPLGTGNKALEDQLIRYKDDWIA